MNNLKKFDDCYESLIKSNKSNDEKSHQIGKLMAKMEKEFQIPILKNPRWEKENKAVTALYRKMSMSRNL